MGIETVVLDSDHRVQIYLWQLIDRRVAGLRVQLRHSFLDTLFLQSRSIHLVAAGAHHNAQQSNHQGKAQQHALYHPADHSRPIVLKPRARAKALPSGRAIR